MSNTSGYVIPTRFTAFDGVSSVVRTMRNNVGEWASSLNTTVATQERLFRRFTPGLSAATKQLLSYASAGALLAGIGASGKAIMDNETAFQSLSAVTGVVGERFAHMRGQVNELAKDTKRSSTDIAGAFEEVGSMMSQYLDDPKAMRMITKEGITLAKASRQELVPTMNNLTSVMNQFNLVADKSHDTIERLTAGEIVGSLRTAQVTEALQEFGAGAYAANINITESVALVEALARQMKTDKIGVGARNILTVMDSATGLARKARKELRAAGVDMGFLMDKTHSLSERLHELSKVSGNEKAITKIFGRENKTAAQVIFNQLDVYDRYVAQIAMTNQAEQQAATNSMTFATAVDQLKNTWVNYLVTQDEASVGLQKASNIVQYLTSHMDGIVRTGINVIEFYAAWKAAIIGLKVVSTGFNVALGIQTALQGASTITMRGNTVALTTQTVAMKALGLYTSITTGNFSVLNTVMAMNPAVLIVGGIVALTGAVYLLNKAERDSIENYKNKMKLDTAKNVRQEAIEVDNLVRKYYMLGNSIQKANALAVVEKKLRIDAERSMISLQINATKAQLKKERSQFNITKLLYTGGFEVGKQAEYAQRLSGLQTRDKILSEDNTYITQFAKTGIDAGLIHRKDVGALFSPSAPSAAQEKPSYNYFGNGHKDGLIDYDKLRAAMFDRQQKIVVEFKNAPAGTSVVGGAGIQTPSSY